MIRRGFKKAVERLPTNVKKAVGASKLAEDETFNTYEVRLTAMEAEIEKVLGYTKHFKESALAMTYNTDSEFYKGSTSAQGKTAVENYVQYSEVMRDETAVDLDLLDSRVIVPLGEIKGLLLFVRKLVVKRAHKLVDLTRHTNSYNTLLNKSTRDVSEEKKLYKYETLAQEAQEEYDKVNNVLLEELPLLLSYKEELMLPMFQTFAHIQTRLFAAYASCLENLRKAAAFDFTSSVIERFEARKVETEDLFKQMDEFSSSFVRRVSLLSRSRTQPRREEKNQDSTYDNVSTTNYSTNLAISSSPSHQRSKSNPPSYEESASKSNKDFSTSLTSTKKSPPPAPTLLKARALYDFEPQAEGDLALKVDDVVDIIKKTESVDDWWTGRLRGKIGIFPGMLIVIL
ncbi:BAR adaptor protein Hob1 [Massospora cicadina]|nr:BAR adaptor protein Hob1 [Massospora cicadina]